MKATFDGPHAMLTVAEPVSEIEQLKQEVSGYLDANELYHEVLEQYENCARSGAVGGMHLLAPAMAKVTQDVARRIVRLRKMTAK